jgi:hypothetical protein
VLKTINRKSATLLAALLLLAAPPGVARASSLAFGVPETNAPYTQFGNDGFTFTPTTNITVTALDYYLSPYPPENGTALLFPHDVAIYSVANPVTPLIETTVGPGFGTGVVGGPSPTYSFFVSQSVAPTLLFAGQQYMLAGYSQPDENENGGVPSPSGIPLGSLVLAPGLSLDGYYYDYNGALDYPTIPYATAYVGPNFEFGIPEPATLTLLASGFFAAGGFGLYRRRRRAVTLSPVSI